MLIYHGFMQELTALIWYLRAVNNEPEPVDSVLTFLSGYDTLEYSWVNATAVSVCLRILFVMLQNTNTRLALSHACALQKVHHVLALREEQAIAAPLHMHPQEVMELTKLLHGELKL